ncbi:hypothetical protein SAMN05421890_1522 [Ensifer adhaerens]|nr:hypothetical protein SAMN05421890_1522 [Ensifer adhaerens]
MQLLAFLGFVAAAGFIVWNLVGVVFAKGRRRKKLRLAGVGCILLVASLVGLVYAGDQAAREAGYEDMADQNAARKAGISDPAAWKIQRDQEKKGRLAEKAKADEAAAAERAAAAALAKEKTDKEEQERLSAQKKADEAAEAERIASAEAKKAQEAKCRADLQCWAEDAFVSASIACKVAVQSLAKWDYEWTDSWSEPKLERYRWKDKAKGIVTYIGTKIKFQNGFGAWKHMTYFCDYDPTSKVVVSASAI